VVDVDQYLGRGQAHIEGRHEALAAGENARIVAVFIEQVENLLEALGANIGKRCGFQPVSPL